jgi:sterol desaturase/sphingolipid hydroxylase (fatty acid hydroxylase superfamily)
VLLGSLLAVALWEFCRPRRQRAFPALRRRLGNIGFWVFNLVLAGFTFGPAARFRPQLEAVLGIGLPSWPIPDAALSFVAGFLLLDLLRYLVHRCKHAVPFFWRFHALHHSDPDVDVTTSVRLHPIEHLFSSGVFWLAVILLDIPAAVGLSYGLAVFAIEAVQHGNIRLPQRLEQWLQPVLVTVDMHRIHHSVDFAQGSCNYATVFSIWDRLFGTYTRLTRAEHDCIVFGVPELPRRECLKPSQMLLTPWLLRRAAPAGTRTQNQSRRPAAITGRPPARGRRRAASRG